MGRELTSASNNNVGSSRALLESGVKTSERETAAEIEKAEKKTSIVWPFLVVAYGGDVAVSVLGWCGNQLSTTITQILLLFLALFHTGIY